MAKQNSKEINEQKQTGANYIINFYEEVTYLNHFYAQYVNLLCELKSRYEGKDYHLQDEEKNALNTIVQEIRYHATKCIITYKTIVPMLGFKSDTKLLDAYDHVKNNFIIESETLENFVELFNAVLVKEIIKDLLKSSNDMVNKVFDHAE